MSKSREIKLMALLFWVFLSHTAMPVKLLQKLWIGETPTHDTLNCVLTTTLLTGCSPALPVSS